jgi:hypothetical protein
MIEKLITSASGILLIGLIVILPGWFAENLEPIETAGDNIHPYSEISSSTQETVITPWWQFCNETSIPEDDETIITDSGAFFWYSGASSNLNPLSSLWDASGYWDYFTCPGNPDGSASLTLKGDVSASSMLTAGVDEISVGIDYSGDYTIIDISWFWAFDYFTNGWGPIPGSDTWMFDTYSGLNWFNLTVPYEELIDASTTEGMYSVYGVSVLISLPNGYNEGDIIQTNFKVCPDYLIENVTVGGETTFKPYIQTISNPYHWYHWSLGIGGFILGIGALFVTPFMNLPSFKFMKGRLRS